MAKQRKTTLLVKSLKKLVYVFGHHCTYESCTPKVVQTEIVQTHSYRDKLVQNILIKYFDIKNKVNTH